MRAYLNGHLGWIAIWALVFAAVVLIISAASGANFREMLLVAIVAGGIGLLLAGSLKSMS